MGSRWKPMIWLQSPDCHCTTSYQMQSLQTHTLSTPQLLEGYEVYSLFIVHGWASTPCLGLRLGAPVSTGTHSLKASHTRGYCVMGVSGTISGPGWCDALPLQELAGRRQSGGTWNQPHSLLAGQPGNDWKLFLGLYIKIIGKTCPHVAILSSPIIFSQF